MQYQDQIPLDNQGSPDHMRLFGWHVPFTSNDDPAKQAQIYNQPKIKSDIRIEFTETAMSCSDFLGMVMSKIHKINGDCHKERVRVGNLNYGVAQLPDNMFKFRVSLFGQSWT